MKEITREFNMRVTMILKADDELADKMVVGARTKETRKAFADKFKAVLGADDVQVTGIKDFVMDVEEE